MVEQCPRPALAQLSPEAKRAAVGDLTGLAVPSQGTETPLCKERAWMDLHHQLQQHMEHRSAHPPSPTLSPQVWQPAEPGQLGSSVSQSHGRYSSSAGNTEVSPRRTAFHLDKQAVLAAKKRKIQMGQEIETEAQKGRVAKPWTNS